MCKGEGGNISGRPLKNIVAGNKGIQINLYEWLHLGFSSFIGSFGLILDLPEGKVLFSTSVELYRQNVSPSVRPSSTFSHSSRHLIFPKLGQKLEDNK